MKGEMIFGMHAVQAVLDRHPEQVLEVWIDSQREDSRISAMLKNAQRLGATIHRATRRELDEMAGEVVHQGMIALCKSLPIYNEYDLDHILDDLQVDPFLLVLDGVTDPHNLGACLRSADAAGIHAVIAPRDRAVGLTSTVRKVACGAAEHVPFIQVTNLARTMKMLQKRGIWLIGAAGEAEQALYQADLKGPLAMVMGSEGKGLRRLTREHCDLLINIPMAGNVESLNVSVAAGICLFEALRQRNQEIWKMS
jgi:23S rRNA (guanosine2251-2'-O)-methyltransferase